MAESDLDALAVTARNLAHLVVEASDAVLDNAPGDEWSPRTILAHLRDVEARVNQLRVARMLTEDEPVFADFDETAWVLSRSTARDRKDQILADFALQRQALLNVLTGLRPEEWERGGSHRSRGQFTVRTWVEAIVEHDGMHVAQLERALGERLEDVLRRRAQAEGLRDED